MPLASGQILHDRYRIEAMLGQGGMGAVYRAFDTSLNIKVAVKENLDATPEAHKQFTAEAHILASLSHQNLPRVIDYFFVPDQGQYLVMDYVEGEDLQSMLRRLGTLPEPQVLNWISQICDALAYLHSQPSPIIHRDIKPANIRIRPDGRAMLVDFGIAKIFTPALVTTLGAKAVTPGYSPPEQYGGGTTDPRSDIYALGATLYHLLTGQKPPESVQRVVGQANISPIRTANPQVSPTVEQAVYRAIEIATDRRFQKIADFRAALDQSSTARTVPPQAPGNATIYATQVSAPPAARPAARPASGARSRPVKTIGLLSIAGLVVLVLGGGTLYLVGSLILKTPTPTQPTSPVATDSLGQITAGEAPTPQQATETLPAAATQAGDSSSAPSVAITALAGQNRLMNPSFEQNPAGNPPYWSTQEYGSDMTAEWSTERVMTGQHALFLSTTKATNQGWPGWFTTVPFEGSHTYAFDVRYFTPDGAGAMISIDYLNNNGDILYTLATDCTQPKNLTVWRQLKLTINPTDIPQGTVDARLGLRQCLDDTQYKRTTLFYDDVSLIRSD